MKLKWMSVLALILMVGFVGCSGDSAEEVPATDEAPAAIEDAPAAVEEGSAASDAPAAMDDMPAAMTEEGSDAKEEMPAATEGSDAKAKTSAVIDGLVSKADKMAGVVSAITEQTVEAGCAKCEYKMAGVSACTLAVKIGDTPHIITGEGIGKPSEVGLCQGTKQVKIAGNLLEDGTIGASEFSLVQ
ncbi:MAG: hypothetical protein COA73_18830 [Candidatus Hydrogenedentota bacterium]|nr:MAG: hypothetical protein COA73_18830 [Candidatus Hydrogenedentota bacterium]